MNQSSRNYLLLVLKILVTAACLWWLSRYFDLQTLNQSFVRFSLWTILAGVALHVLSYLAGAIRWWQLFCYLTRPIPFSTVLPSYYLGVFFNNFLPSAYGGDLARTARLFASGMSGTALVNSAIMDRLLGLAAVIAIGGVALTLTDVGVLGKAAWGVVAAGILLLIAAAGLMLLPRWIGGKAPGLVHRWPKLHSLYASFASYQRSPSLIFKGFLLSLLSQLLVVAVFLMLARDAGIGVPASSLVALLMVVFLVASLPVSLGGLGPRESALMALLLPFGVEAADILTISIAYLAILWLSTLPGLFMLFVRIRESKDELHDVDH